VLQESVGRHYNILGVLLLIKSAESVLLSKLRNLPVLLHIFFAYHSFLSLRNCKPIARLSKKAPWLFRAVSGSLKSKKLQAIENQKMIEFGVFRQPQQKSKPTITTKSAAEV
jgi:hypothetical protein